MSTQRIARNLLVMFSSQTVTWALSFATTAITARYLGSHNFGKLALAVTIVNTLSLFVQLGMTTLLARSVARDPERARTLASAAAAVRIALIIPTLVALIVYLHIVPTDSLTRQAAYISFAGMVFIQLSGIVNAILQGYEWMGRFSLLSIVHNAILLLLTGAVAVLKKGVIAYALAGTTTEFIIVIYALVLFIPAVGLSRRFTLSDLRFVTVGSLPFWLNDIFFTVYLFIDAVILGAVAGTDAVGVYSPATRLFQTALFMLGILSPVLLPQLSRLGRTHDATFDNAGRRVLTLTVAISVPIAVGVATFAGPLITLIYGSRTQFPASIPVLQVLALCILPMSINSQLAYLLIASDRQRQWTVAMAASCVVNPLLNLWLIPVAAQQWHNAALGAALALVATEVLQNIYGIALFRALLRDAALARSVGACALGGVGQLAIVWLFAGWWPRLLCGEVLGLVLYGALAIRSGAIPRHDLLLLRNVVLRRRGDLSPSVESI